MRGADAIRRANEAEAAEYLRAARDRDDLTSLWWRFAEHHSGAARERLQAVYAEKLARLGALQG